MPEEIIFISDLLKQERPDPEAVLKIVKESVRDGLYISDNEFEELVGKSKLSDIYLIMIYQALKSAAEREDLLELVRVI